MTNTIKELPDAPLMLAAEDEETDALLLQMALSKSGFGSRLFIVQDGKEAIDYLDGQGRYADRDAFPLPQLVLLDLKMPRMTGFDVLQWLSEQPQFDSLPRVVFSSSSYESDISRARQLRASDYQVKPHTLAEMVRVLHDLQVRWLPQAVHEAK